MTNNLYVPLENRSVLAVSGSDANKFLQGLITNDINKVTAENSIYALMLTPQGKFLYDFFISLQGDKYLLDCARSQLAAIKQKLTMYKLRSDVKIEDLSNSYKILAVINTQSNQPGFTKHYDDELIYSDPRSTKIYSRAIVKNDSSLLEKLNLTLADFATYEELRIDAGIPASEVDMTTEGPYPLYFNMNELNAIDFKKGCYVGQEVTARMQYRGNVRKKLYVAEPIDNEQFPPIGSDLKIGDEVIGKIFSSTKSAALCILLREKVEKENFVCKLTAPKITIRG